MFKSWVKPIRQIVEQANLWFCRKTQNQELPWSELYVTKPSFLAHFIDCKSVWPHFISTVLNFVINLLIIIFPG